MANTLAVAKYFNELHFKKHNTTMTETKMHKMMYFSQRETLMINNNPLFCDEFYACKYGPVLRIVRDKYRVNASQDNVFYDVSSELNNNEKEIVEKVFSMYDSISTWSLSSLSHEEYSWKQAREGLAPDDIGQKKMSISAIKVDARMEQLRRNGVYITC